MKPRFPIYAVPQRESINLTEGQILPQSEYVYFEFNVTQLDRVKKIVDLQVGQILSNFVLVRIEDPFDGASTSLQIGSNDAPDSVGKLDVNLANFYNLDVTNSPIVAKITRVITPIFVTIKELSTTKSTRGKGWGLLNVIQVKKVR